MKELMDIDIPKSIKDVPFTFDWVEYKGEVFFAIINVQKSEACHRPIIDLCYCATKGLINNIVERTVNYKPEHFKPWKNNSMWHHST